jgi:hypothetical protein
MDNKVNKILIIAFIILLFHSNYFVQASNEQEKFSLNFDYEKYGVKINIVFLTDELLENILKEIHIEEFILKQSSMGGTNSWPKGVELVKSYYSYGTDKINIRTFYEKHKDEVSFLLFNMKRELKNLDKDFCFGYETIADSITGKTYINLPKLEPVEFSVKSVFGSYQGFALSPGTRAIAILILPKTKDPIVIKNVVSTYDEGLNYLTNILSIPISQEERLSTLKNYKYFLESIIENLNMLINP